jgi:hypothetical protein
VRDRAIIVLKIVGSGDMLLTLHRQATRSHRPSPIPGHAARRSDRAPAAIQAVISGQAQAAMSAVGAKRPFIRKQHMVTDKE